jgi:hypothetical protein
MARPTDLVLTRNAWLLLNHAKFCGSCTQLLPLNCFSTNNVSGGRSGRASRCKTCVSGRRDVKAIAAGNKRYRDTMTNVCGIDGCERKATSNVHGADCRTHESRIRRHGNPHSILRRGAKAGKCRAGANHPHWQGDGIGYRHAHARVAKYRGRAAEHACVDCAGPAQEWSYTVGCPRERTQWVGFKGESLLVAYSPDPDRYDPRCKSCHSKFDANREREPMPA